MCQMLHVTCHTSGVTCHISCVMFFVCFIDTVGKLLGGGSVINGVTPPSLETFKWPLKQCLCKFVPRLGKICAKFNAVLSRKWVMSGFWFFWGISLKRQTNLNNYIFLASIDVCQSYFTHTCCQIQFTLFCQKFTFVTICALFWVK